MCNKFLGKCSTISDKQGGASSVFRFSFALNLNFDMMASSNYVRFVYDGDGSDTELAGPNGSKNIESVFLNYFMVTNTYVLLLSIGG